jgi:hypothetical protein
MKHTFHMIADILALGEIEELSKDVECGGRGLDGKDGISQSGNRRGFIRQSTGESLLIQVKGEIKAGDLQIKIIGILNAQIDSHSLFKHGGV